LKQDSTISRSVTSKESDVFCEDNFLFFAELGTNKWVVIISWNGEGLFSKYCKANLEKEKTSLLKFSLFVHEY
jgi:hypothetical protein